jgi:hypothetical protein
MGEDYNSEDRDSCDVHSVTLRLRASVTPLNMTVCLPAAKEQTKIGACGYVRGAQEAHRLSTGSQKRHDTAQVFVMPAHTFPAKLLAAR